MPEEPTIAEPVQTGAGEVERPGPPEWPTPIQCMIDRCADAAEGPVFQHQQLLYALGAILRTTAAVLAARYLANPASLDGRIDNCLLSDLRRPTYGNLVGFLRACSKTKTVEWAAARGCGSGLQRSGSDAVAGVRSLFGLRQEPPPRSAQQACSQSQAPKRRRRAGWRGFIRKITIPN